MRKTYLHQITFFKHILSKHFTSPDIKMEPRIISVILKIYINTMNIIINNNNKAEARHIYIIDDEDYLNIL